MTRPTHLLFLCVANSARSQMAEGLARSLFGSARRSSPAPGANPRASTPTRSRSSKEAGHRSGHATPRSPSTSRRPVGRLVITLCAEEVCPVFLGDVQPAALGDPGSRERRPDDRARQMLRAFARHATRSAPSSRHARIGGPSMTFIASEASAVRLRGQLLGRVAEIAAALFNLIADPNLALSRRLRSRCSGVRSSRGRD